MAEIIRLAEVRKKKASPVVVRFEDKKLILARLIVELGDQLGAPVRPEFRAAVARSGAPPRKPK